MGLVVVQKRRRRQPERSCHIGFKLTNHLHHGGSDIEASRKVCNPLKGIFIRMASLAMIYRPY